MAGSAKRGPLRARRCAGQAYRAASWARSTSEQPRSRSRDYAAKLDSWHLGAWPPSARVVSYAVAIGGHIPQQ